MIPNKILERIYAEKDMSTNISTFVSSAMALFIYMRTNDPYLALILFIGVFSLSKVISHLVIQKITEKLSKQSNLSHYSESEKSAINAFISAGTCLLPHSKLRSGKITIDEAGLDSLVARGVVRFVDGSMGDGPTGFILAEPIYKAFLEK